MREEGLAVVDTGLHQPRDDKIDEVGRNGGGQVGRSPHENGVGDVPDVEQGPRTLVGRLRRGEVSRRCGDVGRRRRVRRCLDGALILERPLDLVLLSDIWSAQGLSAIACVEKQEGAYRRSSHQREQRRRCSGLGGRG